MTIPILQLFDHFEKFEDLANIGMTPKGTGKICNTTKTVHLGKFQNQNCN